MNATFGSETKRRILIAAELCEVVYERFDSEAFRALTAPFVEVETWSHGNAQGMGILCGDTVYIVFRGTESENMADWMSDLSAGQSPFKSFGQEAVVHRGFETYAICLEDDLCAFISKHSGKKIVLCGHSLGGAAAVLSAAALSKILIPDEVITFGAPPIGNSRFVTAYNATLGEHTLRFEHNNDCVPVLPGILPWLENVSKRLYLPSAGRSIWVDPSGLKYHADRLLGRILAAIRLNLTAGVSDHSMRLYAEHLKRDL